MKDDKAGKQTEGWFKVIQAQGTENRTGKLPALPLDARGSIDERDIPPGIAPLLHTHDILPMMPSTWETVSECPNGRRYRSKRHGLSVIASGWAVAMRPPTGFYTPHANARCVIGIDRDPVLCSACRELTCRWCAIPRAHWLHVSLARKSRRPELADVDLVANLFGLHLQDGVMLLGGANVIHLHMRLNGPTLELREELLR